YERQHDVSEVPDWYARNITDPDRIAAVNSRLFGEVEEEALEEAALEPEAELPLSQPTEVPDWLCDTMDDAGLFEAAELEEAEPVEAMPDWLAQEMDIAPAVPTPADEIPDWLRAVDADEVPDWLKESLSPAAQAPVPIPPHIAEDTLNFDTMTPEEIMTWMESLAKRQGANKGFTTSAGLEIAEIDPSSVQVDEPGYVSYGIKPQHEVQFSAYYPRQTMAKRRYAFLVYAHLPEIVSEIHQDAGRFRDNLGGEIKTPKTAKKTARLQADTPVTVMLECDELGFEPLALTKRWKLDWVRYDFEFAPSPELVGESFIVRASIMVGSVEVASIKCSIDVVADVAPQVVNNPLAAAKLAYTHAISKMYQRIFVSYSRRDQEVAEMYRLAQLALGNEVFMDSYSIRVGEDWRFALAQAIDNADTFQLFWSENSAGSDNVRDEWDYALRYRCPDTRCESFIRPVFWCQPMPPPPPELAHLHFRFIPFSSTKQWYND
ncbi:MAG: toll/interleukin-1 receptor domain-containing protein, partial [Chloroflexi bacterium]|nr:toll/interleukin-1 receptor domain-containing protein [Chloroflexota bacterium]MDL1885852.1 toll/interleukin-1 receptor domain-containing protein [Anaerolineae bacterium CFX8]